MRKVGKEVQAATDLGRALRKAMPDHFAVKEPFDAVVYRLTRRGDPIVKAPNGDDVVVSRYEGFEKPEIGYEVRVSVTRDGRGEGYSLGTLLQVLGIRRDRYSMRIL